MIQLLWLHVITIHMRHHCNHCIPGGSKKQSLQVTLVFTIIHSAEFTKNVSSSFFSSFLSACLPPCIPIYLYTWQPVYLTTCIPDNLSTCPPDNLSTWQPDNLSTWQPVYPSESLVGLSQASLKRWTVLSGNTLFFFNSNKDVDVSNSTFFEQDAKP